MKNAVSACTGFVLAVALGAGRLTRPEVIRGWVDVFGDWDPTLFWFMAGASPVYALAHRWLLARGAPLLACEISLPASADIDRKLLLGAALFGVGWAIGGVCPGPAFTSLGAGAPWAALFVIAMMFGLWLGAPAQLGFFTAYLTTNTQARRRG